MGQFGSVSAKAWKTRMFQKFLAMSVLTFNPPWSHTKIVITK